MESVLLSLREVDVLDVVLIRRFQEKVSLRFVEVELQFLLLVVQIGIEMRRDHSRDNLNRDIIRSLVHFNASYIISVDRALRILARKYFGIEAFFFFSADEDVRCIRADQLYML